MRSGQPCVSSRRSAPIRPVRWGRPCSRAASWVRRSASFRRASEPVAAEVSRLGVDDAGEILTLQRAAYVTEAQLHDDLTLPALTQSIDDLVAELELPHVTALGIRLGARLVAALRLSVHGEVAEIGRLTVVPDLQGQGLGSTLLAAVDGWVPPSVTRVELFTGERSVANIRLYERKGFVEFKRVGVGSYDLVFLARTIAHQ